MEIKHLLIFLNPSPISKDFNLMDCSSKGCKKQTLSEKERSKFNKCNYKGHVLSDPDSKVSFTHCYKSHVKDISIVSEKVRKFHWSLF